MDELLKFLGAVLAYGGGAAVVAFVVFQFLGKRLLDQWFAKRLDAYRHEQAKELARLRVEVDATLGGALKIQEREFTVLPEAWNRLSRAFGLTEWVASPLQQSPDVLALRDDQLQEYFTSADLAASEQARIRELRAASSKTYERQAEAFKIISHRRQYKATVAVGELQEYLATHGLFLPRPLRQQLEGAARHLRMALFHLSEIERPGDVKNHQAASEGVAKATELRTSIEVAIEARLHSHGTQRPTT